MNGKHQAAADAGWGIGGALLLHVIMIMLAVAWVAFYSYVLAPGHDRIFYEAYAGRSGPVVSVVAGAPVFFLFAWWLARRRGSGRAAWIAAILYLLMDLAIFAVMGVLAEMAGPAFLGGAALKLLGTALGTAKAGR
jgi:hypothetical protein